MDWFQGFYLWAVWVAQISGMKFSPVAQRIDPEERLNIVELYIHRLGKSDQFTNMKQGHFGIVI